MWILILSLAIAQDIEPEIAEPEPDEVEAEAEGLDRFDQVEARLSDLEAAMDRRAEMLEQLQELVEDTGMPPKQPEPKPEAEPEVE